MQLVQFFGGKAQFGNGGAVLGDTIKLRFSIADTYHVAKFIPIVIGIHAVRAGSIVGEHEVIFAGRNENVTLRHSALSREVFADGALKAASFMKGKTAGMYDMSCVLKELL